MLRTLLNPLLAAFAVLAALAGVPAHAGLIAMQFSGSVYGHWSLPIVEDDFPVGTAVSMALTYDDSFIGVPATQFYLGLAPAISGTVTVGSSQYQIQSMRLSYFSYGATADDPSPNYGFHAAGTGPATDDGEVFSGIDLFFSAATLGRPTLIGFGNTDWQVAHNGYLLVSGTATHERLPSPVPLPGTLWLLLAALSAWALAQRGRAPALA